MNRIAIMSLATVFLPVLGACQPGDPERVCIWIGACDSPAAEPEQVIVICDASPSASCNMSTVDSTVTLAMQHLSNSPKSTLEVWTLGQDVGATQKVFQFTITSSGSMRPQAIRAHHAGQMEDAKSEVVQRVGDYLDAPPPSRSPLIRALAKISLTRTTQGRFQHIVLISDGLEYSHGADWECSAPQDTLGLNASIEKLGILTPESLKDATITFAWVTLSPIDGLRCSVEIGTARRVRDLWTSLLTAAGAHSVAFEAGPPDFDKLHALEDEAGGQS